MVRFTGNIATIRSYIAAATFISERTAQMSIASAFQSVGFTVGPGIQAALTPLQCTDIGAQPSDQYISFDMYTSAGFVLTFKIELSDTFYGHFHFYAGGSVHFWEQSAYFYSCRPFFKKSTFLLRKDSMPRISNRTVMIVVVKIWSCLNLGCLAFWSASSAFSFTRSTLF